MLHQLCFSLLVIISLYGQRVASRHIVQQLFYSPYSDYSYTYAGPGPFHQSFQHQHTPFFSPPGTYYDQRQGILRPFPGGGVPVLVDYHKRCSDNFVGLKAHPEQQQYYYVCKPDCVIFGKCQNLQIFNATSSQCAQHPPPEYIPTCTSVGRFPLFSDCHLYFRCEEDLQPKIYSCPNSMVFSPSSKKCINGNKCTPTHISPQSSYMPEICANKFPPCFENGIFRSPSDCSLYYKCDLKNNGVYMQTRLKCGYGRFYDLQKKKCLPAKEVACDCIQVAELVYPKPHNLPFQPAVYPAQYDLDSMIDGQYPIEETGDSITEASSDCDRKPDELVADSQAAPPTTLSSFDLNNDFMEQTDTEPAVLSDYIDMKSRAESEEDEELLGTSLQFVNSSEETAGAEGSGFGSESSMDQISTVTEENLSTVTAAGTEKITEPPPIITTTDNDTTDKPSTIIEKEKLLAQNQEKRETTPITQETESNEDEISTTVTDAPQSLPPETCKNLVENEPTGAADTHTRNPSHTQPHKCLTQHTPASSVHMLDTESMKIKTITEKHNEQKPTTLTLATTTPHTLSTKLITTTENAITTQIRNDTIKIPERDKSEENLLDSALNLETAGTTLSSEKTLTRQTKAIIENREPEEPNATSQDTIPTKQTHSMDTNSLEEDISYEDMLESEIAKRTKAVFLEPKFKMKLDLEPEIEQQAQNGTTLQNLNKDFSINRPALKSLQRLELQEIEQVLTEQKATIPTPALLNTSDSAPSEQSTQVPIIDQTDESADFDAETKIDDFETATQPQELLTEPPPLAHNPAHLLKQSQQENISTNEKSATLRQIDFSDEQFIPVQSKNLKINEIEGQTSFDDDYTTILAESELATTTLASTLANEILTKKETNNEMMLFNKVTAMKRRQTSMNETIQTTTQVSGVAGTFTNFSEQPKSVNTAAESLDSEVGMPNPGNENKEEVSKNEITSAETIEKTSNSHQQQNTPLSHSPSTRSLAPTAQTKTTTTAKTTSEPSEKQTNNLMLHIRKPANEQHPTLDSPPNQKILYYILKTKPVINNNSNNNSNKSKTNNELVAAAQNTDSASREIPRLEIIAERPIDIHFSICTSTCDKDHKHKKSAAGKRAVLLKWFARKSKQTLGLETANDMNSDDV